MNAGFCLAQQLKRAAGARLYCFSDRRRTNDFENRRERSMRRAVMLMMMAFVRVFVIVMRVIVMGVIVVMRIVRVIMLMRFMGVLMRVAMLRLSMVLMFRRDHIDFSGRKPPAHDFSGLQPGAHIERRGRLGKQFERDSRVDQGAEQHIAAYAGKAFEIANTHRVVIVNGEAS